MSDIENVNCNGNCSSCESECDSNFDAIGSTVTLTLDDDTELKCAVLTIFPVKEKQYIALLPINDEGEALNGEVFLYRFIQVPGQQPELENIEDDAEYDLAADAFDEIVESANFDEIISEEELS